MRTEKEMFDLILDTAQQDERIRAVVMNGSRANQSIKRDCFQDFDICYVVTDIEPFKDERYIDCFGEMMVFQKPNSMGTITPEKQKAVVYLMQFVDGNRIDLSITTIDNYDDEGEPTVALLDKDGILPKYPEPTGDVYNIKRPTQKQFDDCCNEFWWLNPYIAKGIWRNELSYTKKHMDLYLRDELVKMLGWYIGTKTDFSISIGKMGKYLKNYLSKEEWDRFEKTYPNHEEKNIWKSLFVMDDLFRDVAQQVAKYSDFNYPIDDDTQVTTYLNHVRKLPKESTKIY